MLGALLLLFALQSPVSEQVDVMVVGSVHLKQVDPDSVPIAISMIQRSLARYRPDLIVVEWLHPSIDPKTTFNYQSLGDLETLGRLWRIAPKTAAATRDSLTALIATLKQATVPPSVIAAARVQLGKAFYLAHDQINAAYQWWRAEQSGADVSDLKRLTRNNFEGHEANEFGFKVGVVGDIEYISAFDYQGPEARSEVWGEMLDALTSLTIAKIDRVTRDDPRWGALADTFAVQRRRFESQSDPTWLRRYGSAAEVKQYVAVLKGFEWQLAQQPTVRDGLTLMRYLQSPAYEAVERRVQTELIPGITFGGFGTQRLQGIMARNSRMFDFLQQDVAKTGAKRVMVVVGAAHKFAIEDIARARRYRVVPSHEYMPH